MPEALGGLYVAKDSHKHDVQTNRTQGEREDLARGLPVRSAYDTQILSGNFEEICLELEWGQCLMFQNSLVHKSGLNRTTDQMRYVMSAFLHDVDNPAFRFHNLDQKK
jgi:ectoine hydroxylase-related dioxygenase (phytanoyl-CoA dioxygenase family)